MEEEGDDQPFVGEELAKYRSVAATANFIAQDRPDVKFVVKEALPRHGQADICQLAEDEEVGEILQRAAAGRTR